MSSLSRCAIATLLLLWTSACSTSTERSGEQLYRSSGCMTCHGPEGAGGAIGPSIRGMAEFWERDSLLKLLRDPRGTVASNPRLEAIGKRFNAQMPSFGAFPDDQLERIADFVLSLE